MAHKGNRASYNSVEPNTPHDDVEEIELSKASGARVWTIALFTMIACLGSMLNGFVLGYSSATLIDLNSTNPETGEHSLSSNSPLSSLFGVRNDAREFIYLCVSV